MVPRGIADIVEIVMLAARAHASISAANRRKSSRKRVQIANTISQSMAV